MNRYLVVILVFVISNFDLEKSFAAHDYEYIALDPILSSAENFFISVKNSEFEVAWDLLSENSHEIIINDVYDVTRKISGDINREDIIRDFNSRGLMFTNYWNSFHRAFDADMILEHSEWEIGFIKKDKAEILITFDNSQGPTVLKMSKEKNTWRVGLAETFWQRNTLNLLHFIFQ